ncbi:MAG TPA: lipopolysaccharide transport periplasmic protein LptA [Ramlibacter sp.]|uniref:lipopolysaccharide transport periplasmic protein LptA n=1 Tax=Ramlibacter sp. TaxID=1917967 RepID=UPI002B96AADC|nr:lipopolysaccharide transport periplasmic protein LptA [Ramlibacter sp.]HVZ46167.1 lipopolysaccharide transport periplasmic protein LptA [Ramlibacter sp.]
MTRTFLSLLFHAVAAVALAATVLPAAAEKADRAKPMNVEADALRYDDLRQTSVFTGRVVVTKGTIVIRGAKVEVKQDPEGYQFGVVTADPGRLAFYRQKRDGLDEWIEGEAQTIEYDGRADRVKFIGNAQMRRLRGATLNDDITGSLITYDNTSDVFTVDGGPVGGAPAAPGGRVRATLAPRSAASASLTAPPAPAGPAAGAASAAQPARLRPSTRLSGEPR